MRRDALAEDHEGDGNTPHDVLELDTLEELHRRMFGQTWTWTGAFRTSERTISPYSWPEVPRLVRIHPWPNGNGRHSRLATELLLQRWKRPPFTWGAASGGADQLANRSRYIAALRRADNGEFKQLYEFVRA